MQQFNIEKRRKELNLTLEQIGDYVGVSKSTVKKWESGFIDNMKRDKIALLAEILKVSPLEIIGIETSSNKTYEKDEFNLTIHEEKLITLYRSKPEMQPAVDKLLGVDEEPAENVAYAAAQSGKKIKTGKPSIDDLIEINNEN